jgi:hypothetical protein
MWAVLEVVCTGGTALAYKCLGFVLFRLLEPKLEASAGRRTIVAWNAPITAYPPLSADQRVAVRQHEREMSELVGSIRGLLASNRERSLARREYELGRLRALLAR